jgi:hypothetical protein
MKSNVKVFKRNHIEFLVITVMFLSMFFLLPREVNAADEIDCIDIGKTYEEVGKISENLTEVPGMHSYYNTENTNTSNSIMLGANVFCTTCYCTGVNVMNNPDISPSNKMGLVEMANDRLKALLYTPPTVDVAEHMAQEWVPGYKDSSTSVFAGGYEELQATGVASIWSRTRNFAYLCFVVIMIIGGFMIMFRSKLGGQTMVTLGNVIPNVILALVLVTFSFAIAGIIIDIGAVLVNVVVSFLYGDNSVFEPITTGNPLQILWRNWMSMGAARRQLTFEAIKDPASTESIVRLVRIFSGAMNPLNPGGSVITALTGMKVNLFTIIISGIMFVGAIGVYIALLKSYLLILIGVILGPIQIMISALPGQKHMLSNWFKGLIRNTLVFPVALAIVNLPFALFGEGVSFQGLPEGLTSPGGSLDADNSLLSQVFGVAFDVELMVVSIMRIVVLFMAAQTPKLMEAVLPPDTPKALAEGMAKAKESFSKVPLIGSMFK